MQLDELSSPVMPPPSGYSAQHNDSGKDVKIIKNYQDLGNGLVEVNIKSPPQQPSQLFVPWRADPRCRLCRQVTRIAEPKTIEHYSYLNLKISAARGCPLCQFLYAEISTQSKEQNTSQALLLNFSSELLSAVDYTSTSLSFELFSTFDDSRKVLPSTTYRSIAPHTDSESCWSLVKNWLSNCTSSHSACTHHEREQIFPTRVLDVTNLRLVTLPDTERTAFATLSHCWGNLQVLVATKARISSLLRGIDVNTLPKTFRDAITVTRKLGIRYLWIDALCILQDNPQEWEIEVSRMALYYRDCLVNISALSATNGHVGFLHRRPEHPFAQLQNNLHLRRSQPKWRDVFQQSPLSQRAWVLQERLLSTRVVHFAEGELFWECLTLSARESSSQEHVGQGQSPEWDDENFKRSLQFPSHDVEQIMSSWYRVISQYSSLQLTVRGDIFPAISGIAQIFCKVSGLRYTAGLWVEHVHSGLLWYRVYLGRKDVTGDRRKDSWKAPSWSWASAEGPVQNIYGRTSTKIDTERTADVIRMEATPASADPFAGIKDACLELNAFCAEVWCKSTYGFQPFNDPYLALILDIYDLNGVMIATGYRDFLRPEQGDDLEHCLAVVISQRSDPAFESVPITYFILVVPVPDSEPLRYERIGIGQTADSHNGTIVGNDPFSKCDKRVIMII